MIRESAEYIQLFFCMPRTTSTENQLMSIFKKMNFENDDDDDNYQVLYFLVDLANAFV